MNPFGATRGARGAQNCPSVQPGVVTRFTRWLTVHPVAYDAPISSAPQIGRFAGQFQHTGVSGSCGKLRGQSLRGTVGESLPMVLLLP